MSCVYNRDCHVVTRPLTAEPLILKGYVRNLDIKRITSVRAGVILYTVYERKVYFGFGIDADSHDLTDFAGGVAYKRGEDVLAGALREFQEETLNIFGFISKKAVTNCFVLYDANNFVLFLPIALQPNTVSAVFLQAYKDLTASTSTTDSSTSNSQPEVCGITWLKYSELISVINTPGIMFERLRNFLATAGNITCYL